jgi:hypothetical protein
LVAQQDAADDRADAVSRDGVSTIVLRGNPG